MNDLQEQLEQAKRDRQLNYDTANAEIARLEKAIEAEKKPKLENMEYGIAEGEARIFLRGGTGERNRYAGRATLIDTAAEDCAYRLDGPNATIFGNLKADIAELAKGPLESFPIFDDCSNGSLDFDLVSDGRLRVKITDLDAHYHMSRESLPKLIAYLRRMKLTQDGVL